MLTKKYRRNIPLLIASDALAFFGITSLWVIYLSKNGMNLAEIGILEGIFHLTSLLFELPSGALADRFSYKLNLFLSLLLNFASCIFMIIGGSIWIFATGMILNALSYNFSSGTSDAFLFESTKGAKIQHKFLRMTSFRSGLAEASLMLGSLVAGLFVHHDMVIVYDIKIGLLVVAGVLLIFTKEPTQALKEVSERMTIRKIIGAVKFELKNNDRLVKFMIIEAIISVIIAVYFFLYQNELARLSGVMISAIMVVSTLIQIFSSWLATKIGEKFSMEKLFPVLFFIGGILFFLCFSGKFAILLAVFLLTNALYGIIQPIFMNYLNHEIPSAVRATMISVSSMLFSIGMIFLFPLMSFLVQQLSISVSFGCMAFVLLGLSFFSKQFIFK